MNDAKLLVNAAFLVVADEAFGRQIPFAYLDKIKEEFQHKYAERARTALAHSLDKTFGWVSGLLAWPTFSKTRSYLLVLCRPRLKEQMDYCMAHPEELTKVAAVQKKVCPVRLQRAWLLYSVEQKKHLQVDEVKNIMVDNIERVLERGEKIELLVDKSENLRDRVRLSFGALPSRCDCAFSGRHHSAGKSIPDDGPAAAAENVVAKHEDEAYFGRRHPDYCYHHLPHCLLLRYDVL